MVAGPIDPIKPLAGFPGLDPVRAVGGAGAAGGAQGGQPARPFSEVLSDALSQVNQFQLEADRQSMLLATGQASEIHSVMIAAEKAELALELTLQLRNKALEAYQEIMRMQV